MPENLIRTLPFQDFNLDINFKIHLSSSCLISGGFAIKGDLGRKLEKVYAVILGVVYYLLPSLVLFTMYGSVIFTMYKKQRESTGIDY